MAGTVGGSIGLDAEYYCRRCDNKMDLVSHVADFSRVCRSVGSRKEAKSVLDLGLCALLGSKRAGARKLHGHINSALSKVSNFLCIFLYSQLTSNIFELFAKLNTLCYCDGCNM